MPDPLTAYQSYDAADEDAVAELLASCTSAAGLQPNQSLVREAARSFVAEFEPLLVSAPSVVDEKATELGDRGIFPAILADRLANIDVVDVELLTYTAEVDAGMIDRFHIRGEKRIDIYKRSILVELRDQQELNLNRLAGGASVRLWDKRKSSVDASERLANIAIPGTTVTQYLYPDAPTKRAYIFDRAEALIAYYEPVMDPYSEGGSAYKGVTSAPSVHISDSSPLAEFHLGELASCVASLRGGSRSWDRERAILFDNAEWDISEASACVALKSVLFDLDGVLYDSLGQYVDAWTAAFSSCGVTIEAGDVFDHESRRSSDAVRMLLRRYGADRSERTIEQVRAEIHDRLSAMPRPPVMRGAIDLVAAAKETGLEVRVVTGSSRPEILRWIEADFSGILTAADVYTPPPVELPGKPHPMPYLLALTGLGLRCCDAIAIENSPLGVRSASAANIFCIAVNTGGIDAERLIDAGARVVFDSTLDVSNSWSRVVEILTL
jgi:beta-phosphoglucomutase-like phosphatase (HAD superfamily)